MKFKKLTVLPIAAVVFASGACSNHEKASEDNLSVDTTSTTQVTEPTTGSVEEGKVFIPESDHIPTTIECSTRAIDSNEEMMSKVISHIKVEKGLDGKTFLIVTPDLYHVDEEAPDFIKEALIPGRGGKVEMNSEVKPFTLGFDRSKLHGLSDFSFMVAFSADGTALVSTFTGEFSSVTAQSVDQGMNAAGMLTATPAEGAEVNVVDKSGREHVVGKRNVPDFVIEGRSVRTEHLNIHESSSIDVHDKANQIGCETSIGVDLADSAGALPRQPIGRNL